MTADFPRVSTVDGLRFTLQVALPNLVQGSVARRPRPVAVAAALDMDRRAIRLVQLLRRRYGPGPMRLSLGGRPALLVSSVPDIRRVLDGSPEPFANDVAARVARFGYFAPDAVAISTGELWRDRHAFHRAVLDLGVPVHQLAEQFVEIAGAEAEQLRERQRFGWAEVERACRRVARRVVFGAAAADDEALTALLVTAMIEANSAPERRSQSVKRLHERIESYVEKAEEGSLVGLFPGAPTGAATRPAGQVPNMFFGFGESLTAAMARALALIGSHPLPPAGPDPAWLRACLLEGLRLWPTVPLLTRRVTADVDWDGVTVPAGTTIVIYTPALHRDRRMLPHADRFMPSAVDGSVAIPFGRGPQGCPGEDLSLLVGSTMLATLLTDRHLRTVTPRLDPRRPLPHTVNQFRFSYTLG